MSTGAGGYVVKSDAAAELLPAVNAVLEGKRFGSARLAAYRLDDPPNQHTVHQPWSDNVVTFQPQNVAITRHHEVGFYSEDRHFLDHVTRFIAAALKAGNAVIVVATESHRESLLSQLQAAGLDMGAAIEEGRYIPLDAADTLSTFMVNGSPDPVQFLKVAGDLIVGAAKAVNGDSTRVTACGEAAPLLWAQGNLEAAIRVERLWDEIAMAHKIHLLCAYSLLCVFTGQWERNG